MDNSKDIDSWLSYLEIDDFEEVYCLYRALNDVDKFGLFECSSKPTSYGKQFFLKCDFIEELLRLPSEKARQLCLEKIQQKFVKNGMTVEGWYIYERGMREKD